MPDKPVFTGAYAPMQGYIAPLRGDLWRFFVGLGVIAAVYLLGSVIYFLSVVVIVAASQGELPSMEEFNGLIGGTTPQSMLVFLGSFVCMTAAVMVAALWPAQRSIASLIGPSCPALSNFLRVIWVMILPLALIFGMTLALDPTVAAKMDLVALLPWLPFALAGMLIQTSAEELAFRGFVMGQLAARSSSIWVWMILPSLLFGAALYNSASYGNYAWVICGATTLFALAASDLTARTGNLGAAIAMHFANNFMATILISQAGVTDGLALYTARFDPSDMFQILAQIIFVLILWLAARFALKV